MLGRERPCGIISLVCVRCTVPKEVRGANGPVTDIHRPTIPVAKPFYNASLLRIACSLLCYEKMLKERAEILGFFVNSIACPVGSPIVDGFMVAWKGGFVQTCADFVGPNDLRRGVREIMRQRKGTPPAGAPLLAGTVLERPEAAPRDGLEGPVLPRRAILAGLCGLAGVLVCPENLLAAVLASNVRLGSHDGFTRVVIDLSEQVNFSLFTLPDPARVVVDLPEIAWQLQGGGVFGGGGLVTALRYGLFQPGNSRVVFDLARPASIKQAFVLPPGEGGNWRFVMDLELTTQDAFLRAAGPDKKIGSFMPAAQPQVQEAAIKVPEPPREVASGGVSR